MGCPASFSEFSVDDYSISRIRSVWTVCESSLRTRVYRLHAYSEWLLRQAASRSVSGARLVTDPAAQFAAHMLTSASLVDQHVFSGNSAAAYCFRASKVRLVRRKNAQT